MRQVHPIDPKAAAEAFFKMGEAHILRAKATGVNSCMAIHPDDPEWSAWVTYFRNHLGWTPAVVRMVENHSAPSMTVPCQWPEWLDSSYASNAA